MKTLSLLTIGAVLAGCASAPPPSPASNDAAFLQETAQQALLEIRLGELAQRYAQLPDIRAYGRRMAEDRQQELAALAPIAQDLKVALPVTLDAEQTDLFFQMSQIAGDPFHRQYMDRELWAKQGEIDALSREALGNGDPRLVAFAQQREAVVADNQQLGLDVELRNHLNLPIPHAGGGNSR
ncbi:MAG TPA: DUF4142 domain-containing protein [Aliidongia sp.]|nr:DUF4142 domain-containing protein [Aliidongia sp.]